MEHRHKDLRESEANVLLRHWNTLKQNIRMVDIVNYLIEKGVLKQEEWDMIRKRTSTEKDVTEDFLSNIVLKKPSSHFVIFREALRENGYEHLAEKLDKKEEKDNVLRKSPQAQQSRKVSGKNESDGGKLNAKLVMKRMKELDEKDKEREMQITEYINRGKQIELQIAKNKQEFEQKLEMNLRKTNKELNRMRESLQQKEIEIEYLIESQRQQEETNRALLEENRKLETSREHMFEEIDRQKEEIGQINCERHMLKNTVERQKTQLEGLTKERDTIRDNLEREKTVNKNLIRQNTTLSEWINNYETEGRNTERSNRRQPTGISITSSHDSNDDTIVKIRQMNEKIMLMKEDIKQMEKSKKTLEELRKMKVEDSKICTIQ